MGEEGKFDAGKESCCDCEKWLNETSVILNNFLKTQVKTLEAYQDQINKILDKQKYSANLYHTKINEIHEHLTTQAEQTIQESTKETSDNYGLDLPKGWEQCIRIFKERDGLVVRRVGFLPTPVWTKFNQALWSQGFQWNKQGKNGYWSERR